MLSGMMTAARQEPHRVADAYADTAFAVYIKAAVAATAAADERRTRVQYLQ
jgi:hypothetical protein